MTAKSPNIYKNKIIKNKKGSIIKYVNKKNKFLSPLERSISQKLKKV